MSSKNGTLVMLIGISGSGKSRYVRQNFQPSEVVCPDDIRRELTGNVSDQSVSFKAWCIAGARIQKILDRGGRAVLDGVNVGSKDRAKFLANFPRAEKIAVVFKYDVELSKRRVADDLRAGVDRSSVPPDVIEKQAARLEAGLPNIEKQFDKVVYVDSTNEEVARNMEWTAGVSGGIGGGGNMTDLPPKEPGDGSEHAEAEGRPEFVREAIESVGSRAKYSAIVLDNESRNQLLETFYHGNADVEGWEAIAHHMTLRMGPISQPKKDLEPGRFNNLLGQTVELQVKAVGLSDKALAVEVAPVNGHIVDEIWVIGTAEKKKTPWHITIAIDRASGAKPVDSNRIEQWTPVRESITVAGTVTEIV